LVGTVEAVSTGCVLRRCKGRYLQQCVPVVLNILSEKSPEADRTSLVSWSVTFHCRHSAVVGDPYGVISDRKSRSVSCLSKPGNLSDAAECRGSSKIARDVVSLSSHDVFSLCSLLRDCSVRQCHSNTISVRTQSTIQCSAHSRFFVLQSRMMRLHSSKRSLHAIFNGREVIPGNTWLPVNS
jgi:hypothetical protein